MDERLKKFVQLVDAGSFTKAASELHVSQPALSVSIAKLERELRTLLLVRGARPLLLTPAGHLAYSTGKDMLIRVGNLRTQLAELAQQEVSVSVGMIDSVASLFFASASGVDELERQASVSLVVDNSRNLSQAVENGELDMAFVVGRRHSSLLEVTARAVEPLAVVCHAKQQATVNRAVRTGKPLRFISYNQASVTHQLVADALRAHNITPTTTFYSTSPEVMLRMVLLQKGIAALPHLLVRDYLAAGELALIGRPVPLFIERPIHAIKRRDTVLATSLLHAVSRVGALLSDMCVQARIPTY